PLTIIPLAAPNRNPPTIFPGESFKIEARLAQFERPDAVAVAVRPPAPDLVTGEPVTALPRVDLALESDEATTAGQLWSAVINTAPTTSTFNGIGNYQISASARFDQNRVSNPQLGTVLVSQGLDADATPIRSIIGIGAGPNSQEGHAFENIGEQSYGV